MSWVWCNMHCSKCYRCEKKCDDNEYFEKHKDECYACFDACDKCYDCRGG